MLAEKVETPEECSEAMEMGYSLFQGYFFCRPEMMQQRAIPASKLAYLDLLGAAMAAEFDMPALALKIKHEPSLTYKLLRYLNSAGFGLRTEIYSIPHALSMLGERELRKWIAVVSVGVMADGKSDELMTVPLVRGRFLRAARSSCPHGCSLKRSLSTRSLVRDGCHPRSASCSYSCRASGPQRCQGSIA